MYLRANDIISGSEATAYMTVNKENELMFYATSLTATATKEKISLKTLGKRGTQYKTNGWSGSGKMTIYYATSRFRELMSDYISNGIETPFSIMVTNEDPTSTLGKEEVVLKNVTLNSVVMTAFDVSKNILSEEISFTFDDIELLSTFTLPEFGEV
ncbi:MAG: phage tail tube protein [Clostridia bacterium]